MLRLCLKEKPPHLREQLVKGMPPRTSAGGYVSDLPDRYPGQGGCVCTKPFETLRLKR